MLAIEPPAKSRKREYVHRFLADADRIDHLGYSFGRAAAALPKNHRENIVRIAVISPSEINRRIFSHAASQTYMNEIGGEYERKLSDVFGSHQSPPSWVQLQACDKPVTAICRDEDAVQAVISSCKKDLKSGIPPKRKPGHSGVDFCESAAELKEQKPFDIIVTFSRFAGWQQAEEIAKALDALKAQTSAVRKHFKSVGINDPIPVLRNISKILKTTSNSATQLLFMNTDHPEDNNLLQVEVRTSLAVGQDRGIHEFLRHHHAVRSVLSVDRS